jgi:mono/diheme cytochrome c family protein
MRKAALAILMATAGPALCSDAADFFETRVRPVLAKNCYACHTDAKMGGLQLDSREHALKGGNGGPVIVPGDPEKSRMVEAVRQTGKLKMPPSGKLSDGDVEAIATWIKDGAVWQGSGKVLPSHYTITKEQRAFWAFQPVIEPPVPAVKNGKWARTEIDRFILAKLEEKSLRPALFADRRTLIRRAYFDLTGLPPTNEEVAAFVADRSPDAYTKIVDRLLASQRYGERWGRYWLDIARYSDDKLNSTQEDPYPNAFRYRDWVIQAFNDDMPYDKFAMAQIAGDKMGEPEKYRAGLGFYALSPEFQDDRVDATTRGFLALTVACAQCHDHKYDPIPTKDYYSLLGVFNGTHLDETPLAPKDTVEEWKAQRKKLDAADKELKAYVESQGSQLAEILAGHAQEYLLAVAGDLTAEATAKLDAPTIARWKAYLANRKVDHPFLNGWREAKTEADRRREAAKFQELLLAVNAEKKSIDDRNRIRLGLDPSRNELSQANLESLARDRFVLWNDFFGANKGILIYKEKDLPRYLSSFWKGHLEDLRATADRLKKELPEQYPYLQVIKDNAKPVEQHVWLRGSRENQGELAPPHFLSILSASEPQVFDKGEQRLGLACAIADPKNPLTARVLVNRIWQHHFGQGIVRTASNFGQLGDRPSNPALLDYLAAQFVKDGWSIKKLHREIMLSSVYMLSTQASKEMDAADPENRLLAHANRQRLDAEAIRDEILFASGNLDLQPGGKPAQLDVENHRRTVYGFISRRKLNPYLQLFDYPIPNATSEARNQTNVPLQRLFFMNSPIVLAESKVLAKQAGTVDALYERLFQRRPTVQERQLAQQFLAQSNNNWPEYAQVLMSSNEFLFIN